MTVNENELWAHQRNCIAQANEAIKEGKNAVISLPPGAGKSRMMLEVVKEFIFSKQNARILIIANRRVLLDSVWRAEIHKWTPELSSRVTTVDGRREPYTRDTFWSHAKEYNYVVTATPHVVMKDISAGVLRINDFDLIILDEVHHSIKFTGGMYKRSLNYHFLDGFNHAVVGITIKSNTMIPKKVHATAKLLNAVLITDTNARERNLEKKVIQLNNSKREKAEEILDKEIGRLLVIFKNKYPNFSGFPFEDIERTKNVCNISNTEEVKKIEMMAGQYYKIKTIKRYLDEDNAEYVMKNLLPSTNSRYSTSLLPILDGWEKIKLKTAIENTKSENDLGNPVIIFVKFRATAQTLYLLFKENGIQTGLLIGGIYDYPSEKLKEFTRKGIKCLVATQDMCGEGLNLQYFRTIILCGGIQNEFKRLNIEGRIRGGRLVQLLYTNSDEIRGMVKQTDQTAQNVTTTKIIGINLLQLLLTFFFGILSWIGQLFKNIINT
jgi:ERCC4-related helicase